MTSGDAVQHKVISQNSNSFYDQTSVTVHNTLLLPSSRKRIFGSYPLTRSEPEGPGEASFFRAFRSMNAQG